MIIYILIGALALLFSSVLGVLPCGVLSDVCTEPFLAMPSQVTEAFGTIGQTAHFFIFYFGDGVGNAFLSSFKLTILIGTVMMLWRMLVNFRAPIISRFTHGQHNKDV